MPYTLSVAFLCQPPARCGFSTPGLLVPLSGTLLCTHFPRATEVGTGATPPGGSAALQELSLSLSLGTILPSLRQ